MFSSNDFDGFERYIILKCFVYKSDAVIIFFKNKIFQKYIYYLYFYENS